MIEIVDRDPNGSTDYQLESDRLLRALGRTAIRIDHVGSTSIPGLGAKPIIDIQISVEALEPVDAYREPLARAGYRRGTHPDDDNYPFFHKPESWPHTHHVHVCVVAGVPERNHLAFCSYLRHHPEAAAD
jgi:GrpB-like predicted nucleotidyltransferase (UPF0157 family)